MTTKPSDEAYATANAIWGGVAVGTMLARDAAEIIDAKLCLPERLELERAVREWTVAAAKARTPEDESLIVAENAMLDALAAIAAKHPPRPRAEGTQPPT